MRFLTPYLEDSVWENNLRDIKDLFLEGGNHLDISFGEEELLQYLSYFSILSKWNRTFNIVGTKKDREIVAKHFLDSLLVTKGLPQNAVLLDIGSGGGFPGLVIKIRKPKCKVFLLEPRRKRASFLRYTILKLNLAGIYVLQKRVEEIKDSFRSFFDVVTQRALFSLDTLCKLSFPLLKEGGKVVFMGTKPPSKVPSNFSIEDVLTFSLPWSFGKRVITFLVRR